MGPACGSGPHSLSGSEDRHPGLPSATSQPGQDGLGDLQQHRLCLLTQAQHSRGVHRGLSGLAGRGPEAQARSRAQEVPA